LQAFKKLPGPTEAEPGSAGRDSAPRQPIHLKFIPLGGKSQEKERNKETKSREQ